MKNTWIKTFAWLLLLVFTLNACGGADTVQPTSSTTGGAPKVKAILVINGNLGDKSYTDSAQRGMDQAAKDLGIETKTVELGFDNSKWQSGLEDVAANQEYDILVTGTFSMVEFVTIVAAKYPAKKFIIFDNAPDYADAKACPTKCPNIYSIVYKQNEGSYLAGLYAGLMAKENPAKLTTKPTVGVIGGIDIPVINDFIVGYKQGARDAGLTDADVLVQFAGGFNDPARGKEIAKAMYQQGAAIVFGVAGGTGLGMIEGAAEDKRLFIGVDSDQWLIIKDQKPEQAEPIATSMLKNVDNSLVRAFKLNQEGKLAWGTVEALGVVEGGVGLAQNDNYNKITPDAVKTRIKQAEQDLKDGKIKVETAFK